MSPQADRSTPTRHEAQALRRVTKSTHATSNTQPQPTAHARWRCHRTSTNTRHTTTATPAYWTAGHTQHGSTTAQPWTAPLITRAHCDQALHGDYLAPEASVCNYGAKDSTPVERIATTRHW